MSDEREKVRCQSCELVQWKDRSDCRRCGATLPQPIVKIVERVVERIIIRSDASCAEVHSAAENVSETNLETHFPTMVEVERTLILAAYRRSNRRPLEAARLLGIGKTTMYRKLREMGQAAA